MSRQVNTYFDEEDSDDDLPPHTSVLVLGRTNTGKSTLCRNLLAEFKEYRQPVAILNFRSRKKKNPHKIIEWKDLATLRNTALLVEDLIQITKPQYEALSHLLNWSVHHENVSPTICVSQQIHKMGIVGLLGSFTRVYVTASKANIYTWKRLLSYYAFDDREQKSHVNEFRACQIPHTTFFLDVETLTITRVNFPLLPEVRYGDNDDDDGKKRRKKKPTMSSRETLALAKANRYLSVLSNHKEALAIFELLYYKLPKSAINSNTLEITLQQKGSVRPVVISLVEYIATLVDGQKKVPVSRLMHKFHKYTQAAHAVSLPRHFVLNTDFH